MNINTIKIKKLFAEIVSEVSSNNMKSIMFEKSLLEQGISSILAVELIEKLNETLGTQLGVEALFDFQNVDDLVLHIANNLPISQKGADDNKEAFSETKDVEIREYVEIVFKEIFETKTGKKMEYPSNSDNNLIDMGINSILAVEIIEDINKVLRIELGIEVLFECGSISQLIGIIETEYKSLQTKSIDEHVLQSSKEKDHSVYAPEKLKNTDIAIIGMSGKFAGAESVDQFWDYLQSETGSISEITREGWDENQYYHPDPMKKNKSVSKWGGMLDDIDKFDAEFFNISPEEAERMDPQQRLFLEESYKAFEDAGYSEECLNGRNIGVFVGARASSYKEKALMDSDIDSRLFIGTENSMLASRISYFLNLKGVSLVIDTACSSSLVAIHLACASINSGESEIALAGGVFVNSSPDFMILTSNTGMLSEKGQCFPFDNRSNGMVLGEGVGAVILKSLNTAISDGDHIYGIIKGSNINHDGKTNGITSPSVLSQKALLYETYKKFNIHPETISLIEAHGTGTKLGDSMEVKALTETFDLFTDKRNYCAIGSTKGNFGHSTLASGMASIFKVLLSMRYKKIPVIKGIKEINELINLENSAFHINKKMINWDGHGAPLRAGINALGSGGTNCHIILEQSPVRAHNEITSLKPYYVFAFSAKTIKALEKIIVKMSNWLTNESHQYSIEDISYSLLTGRNHFPYRIALIASDLEELNKMLVQTNLEDLLNIGNDKRSVNKNEVRQINTTLKILAEDQGNLSNEEYNEALVKLVQAYINGFNISWKDLFNNNKCFRVPLPTYSFIGERYWLPRMYQKHKIDEQSAEVQSVTNTEAVNDLKWLNERGGLQVKSMEPILVKMLYGQLYSMGLFNNDLISCEDLLQTGTFYKKWLRESLEILTRHQMLRCEEGKYSIINPIDINMSDLWREWKNLKQSWINEASMRAQVTLVEETIKGLPEIIMGKVPATEIMFPNSSLSLVEGVYKDNIVADYFNGILADHVIEYILEKKKRDPNATVRIMEIGAGTGGTSKFIFNQLIPYQNDIEEYYYTDISKAFLLYAEENYGPRFPYVTYDLLNIETTPSNPQINGDFDIVIAANVLHATSDIKLALQNVKSYLCEKGILLLNEISKNSLFLHMTFGLLEGWWLFKDHSLRIAGCPALSSKKWSEVLEDLGFCDVQFPANEAHDLGQQIIYAANDEAVPASKFNESYSFLKENDDDNRLESSKDTNSEILIIHHISTVMLNILSQSLSMSIDRIDPNKPFADYGVDSIVGINIVKKMNQSLSIPLDTTILFDYTSVNQLSRYIGKKYKDNIFFQSNNKEDVLNRGTIINGLDGKIHDEANSNNEKFNSKSTNPFGKEPIAIIGVSGRFSKAKNIDELWEQLESGRELISEIDRWGTTIYPNVPHYDTKGGFLENIDSFDPMFFNISGIEATYMDPQQRLFLEESWKALEDAGYAGKSIKGSNCSVFVGCTNGDYHQLFDQNAPAQAFWGNMVSIIPSRIAYYLNLQGAAVSIDTACSSSLVAIHHACLSLWARESEMALAGGVFVQSTPAFVCSAGKAGMLSSSGHCYTFDDRADGFVPGEGAGAVILKRLSDAVADGDNIYGVIKGSGINQDGTTNGITAPSAVSQERLLQNIYETYHINPAHIQMVEAHGTGTKLGDPIEFNALTRAFRKYTDKEEFCAIGSIKTNIGHTQITAGIAGLTKVLLSLKHKKIPPSLNFLSGNQNIQFEGSPFYVNRKLIDWKVENGLNRCAVVSSFGASGTNAHIVIEEAPELNRNIESKSKYLIPLSARSKKQLLTIAEQLLEYCEINPGVNIGDMSFTLLLGRMHHRSRIAFIVSNISELKGFLNDWLKNKYDSIEEHEELAHFEPQQIDHRKIDFDQLPYLEHITALADFYMKGYELEFEPLFRKGDYKRISLPKYPFSTESYWVQSKEVLNPTTACFKEVEMIHPLVQQNRSDFTEVRFMSTFSGQEFFLKDHCINSKHLLPGAAYLEMVRVSIEQAAGRVKGSLTQIQIRDVNWIEPFVVESEEVTLYISLHQEENNHISFKIYSQSIITEKKVIHCKGTAFLGGKTTRDSIDLDVMTNQFFFCGLSPDILYDSFRRIGIDYGLGHRGIVSIYARTGQILAKLAIPSSISNTKDQYILHPSLLDSSLQATLLLMADYDQNQNVDLLEKAVIFSLGSLEVYSECSNEVWALIQHCGVASVDNVRSFNIDIYDNDGNLCVKMKEVIVKKVFSDQFELNEHANTQLLMFHPKFAPSPLRVVRNNETWGHKDHHVFFCNLSDFVFQKIKTTLNKMNVKNYSPVNERLSEGFSQYAAELFGDIKSILNKNPMEPVLVQVVFKSNADQCLLHALYGMLKTAHSENPKLIGQLIEVEPQDDATGIIEKINDNSTIRESVHVKYHNDEKSIASWEEVSTTGITIPWKDEGVYLISGGSGGLGLIFAKEIIKQSNNAKIILIGRSEIDRKKVALLEEECSLTNAIVEYRQVDVTQLDQVVDNVQSLLEKYGQLNGIIHSAGIIKDNYIIKKTRSEFLEVLEPKVTGLTNLDIATRNIKLDLFILFSSISVAIGNPGQIDYIAGNAYMNEYSTYRNQCVALNQCYGRTISINWPLWKEGGMRVHKEIEKALRTQTGMIPMKTKTGIQAFYQSLASGKDQVFVIEGIPDEIRAKLLSQQPGGTAFDEELLNILESYLVNTVSKIINVKETDVDIKADLVEMGFDPILISKFVDIINENLNIQINSTTIHALKNLQNFSLYLLNKNITELSNVLFPEQTNKIQEYESNKVDHFFKEKVIDYIKGVVSSVTRLPKSKIEANVDMDKYGMDSILAMQLVNELEKDIGLLSKTLFFEYQKINQLSDYLMSSHGSKLKELLDIDPKEMVRQGTAISAPEALIESNIKRQGSMDGNYSILQSEESEKDFDIAIIGLSGRYPQAKNIKEFWKILKEGRDCITEIPEHRWDYKMYYDSNKTKSGKIYSKWGGFMEGVDCFDPLFFNITPKEAEIMDPQERLFLECSYEVLEDAGYTREVLASKEIGGNVGVFAGVMYEEYQLYGAQEQIQGRSLSLWGSPSSIANRVSYFCNFNGPSIAVDTMCSSSLTSIHLAYQSLKMGDCKLAIAGGVNVSIHPNKYLFLSQGNFASSNGKCESFGEGGDGYVPGEGVGAILLKPLTKAIADGDQIYGIIRGTSINHGGKTNGYTVPNPNSQASLISRTLKRANVNPRTISYIEAHGTGTKLGDPIEITGLSKAFTQYTEDMHYCSIGSVKSNIGHCEGAAGIAAITKVLLQMKYQKLVPSLHSQTLNPNIDFVRSPFVVQQKLADWNRPLLNIEGEMKEYPRLAGISSFGAGGSNAHIILEEFIPRKTREKQFSDIPIIIVLSARTAEQLKERARQLVEYIREGNDQSLVDIAYTLQVGREAMEERLAFVIKSHDELENMLSSFIAGNVENEEMYRGQIRENKETLDLFISDEELMEGINKWILRGKYSKLLNLWSKGLSFDWNNLYGEMKPQKISLPTYPFAQDRYWAPRTDLLKKSNHLDMIIDNESGEADNKKLMLTKNWVPCQLDIVKEEAKGIVVILGTANTKELATKLFEKMTSVKLIHVIHGDCDLPAYLPCDYYSESAGKILFQQISHLLDAYEFMGIVDITSFDEKYEQSLWIESGKIKLIQEFIEHKRTCGFKILQVTYRLNSFMVPQTTLQGARLAGLYRMLGTEYKQITSVTMDTDYSIHSIDLLSKLIESEFLSATVHEYTEFCYRQGVRYKPDLEVTKINDTDLHFRREYSDNDVILITGGSRGIGFSIAERLVSQGVKNLIVMGVQELPPESEWKGIIEHNDTSSQIIQRLKNLQHLVNSGASIRYYSTSLSDLNNLKEIIAEIGKEIGHISGVFHCAGIAGKNPAFIKKKITDIAAVCQPKIMGLVNLHQALIKEPLSFFVMCSSLSSTILTLASGQSDYTMANAYMDYYAMHQIHHGKTSFRSIQWPAWGEVGMAADKHQSSVYENTGILSLSTKDGLSFVDWIIGSRNAVSLPCIMKKEQTDYGHFLKNNPALPYSSEANRKIQDPKNWKSLPEEAAVKSWISNIFVSELKLRQDQIEDDKTFDDYGIDSIIIAQLIQTMSEKLNVTLEPTILIEYNTLRQLVKYFLSNHVDQIAKFEGATEITLQVSSTTNPNEIPFGMPTKSNNQFQNMKHTTNNDIAIVGLSCRFPGSSTKKEYWELLCEGKRAIHSMHDSERKTDDIQGVYAGWLDDIDWFDTKYFGIKAEDARVMDPQARIVLEESLKAFLDAGYERGELSGQSIGVYVGGRHQMNNQSEILKANNPILGAGQNYMATNISRFFNFAGPSLVIDSACSSGLTALQIASDALREKRISMALIGATNVIKDSFAHDLFSARNILSSNGEFHIFDKRSDGEVLGEGTGVVIVKRLEDAIKEGNHIYGVIKAVSVNNDGRTLGPGSPNMKAQQQVMSQALSMSGVDLEEVGYIEVNGGGTHFGDTAEIKSLNEVYQLQNTGLSECYLGSVKPNIGHLLLSSSIAGLIRCILSVYYKKIPPFISAVEPFDYYNFSTSRIAFNRETIPWEVGEGKKRIAALNSFPDGGTNCHAIISEFIPDGSYIRRYFPKQVPVLDKINLCQLDAKQIASFTEKTSVNNASEETGLEKIKENFGIFPRKKNIWGDIYGKNN
ncbi:SDR family NAD(P)-dependent oxidoreductase [Paenibacillus sp. GbtcB18]|uniref:SDR family NAD(P)-dependent oxidoreductase n=2 Tax=Bacillales TaxID=1385 RepID=UPI001C2F4228|nr:SDR family NAD(P)-dependent oxidoreductase [Paenibacillus sp. GbtcB18]